MKKLIFVVPLAGLMLYQIMLFLAACCAGTGVCLLFLLAAMATAAVIDGIDPNYG